MISVEFVVLYMLVRRHIDLQLNESKIQQIFVPKESKSSLKYIENITWLRGNMKFISSVNKISHE